MVFCRKNVLYRYIKTNIEEFEIRSIESQLFLTLSVTACFLVFSIISLGSCFSELYFANKASEQARAVSNSKTSLSSLCSKKMYQHYDKKLLNFKVESTAVGVGAKRNTFEFFIRADVGTPNRYSEVTVYCQVNERNLEVTDYRELNPNNEPVKSKVKELFSSM